MCQAVFEMVVALSFIVVYKLLVIIKEVAFEFVAGDVTTSY